MSVGQGLGFWNGGPYPKVQTKREREQAKRSTRYLKACERARAKALKVLEAGPSALTDPEGARRATDRYYATVDKACFRPSRR